MWKRILGVTALVLVVGFAGLELNLRLFGGPIEIFNPLNGFHEGDPVLGWRGQKNITRRFHTPEFDVLVQHDAEGFRRPDPARPEGADRSVLILGDSLGWGWGVGQGLLFSDHLQRALGDEFAIYNRSVNAYATGQELLLLQRELAARPHDEVLVIVSGTDIGDNADDKKHRPAFDLVDGELHTRNQPPPGALKNPVERFIDDHSHATNFLSWQLAALKRWWQSSVQPALVGDDSPEEGPDNPDEIPVLEHASPDGAIVLPGYGVTKRLLSEIAATCREAGAELTLAYATTNLHIRHSPFETGFRDLVAEVAAREGVDFIDLNETLEPLMLAGEKPLIPRDGHWSARGHRAIANVLIEERVFALP